MKENRRSPVPAAGGTTARRRFPRILALASLVLFALALRLAGIDWGLPRSPEGRFFHPDEQHVAWSLSRMDPARFDWNPGHMINPAFFYTLTGCAAVAAPGVPSPFHLDEEEFDRVPPETHARWIRTGRLVSAILGTVGVLFAALTAAALYGSFAGYAAGLLLAVNPAHLVQCHYSAVDTPALAFLSISLWLTVRYTRSGGTRLAMAAAFFAGIAAGTKYFAAPVLAALMVGFLVRRVKRPLLWLSCGLLFGAGLVLAFPAVLDWRTLFGPNGIPRLLSYYPFNENVPKPTGPMLLNTFGFPLALLTAAGLGRALWKRDPIEAPVTVLFFLYLFFLLRSPSPYHRHYLPLVATGVLFAAGALRSLLSPARRPLRAAAAVVATVVVLFALAESLVIASVFLEKDTREEASAWIAKNVPERTSIGLAGPSTGRAYYTPSIHEAKWSVAVTGYDRRLLAAYAPEFFLLTDVELEIPAAARVPFEQSRAFLDSLLRGDNYAERVSIERPLRLGPVRFTWNLVPTDLSYFRPAVTIFESTTKAPWWEECRRAEQLAAAGRTDEAESLLDRLIAGHPDAVPPHLLLAETILKRGGPIERAAEGLEEAIRLGVEERREGPAREGLVRLYGARAAELSRVGDRLGSTAAVRMALGHLDWIEIHRQGARIHLDPAAERRRLESLLAASRDTNREDRPFK